MSCRGIVAGKQHGIIGETVAMTAGELNGYVAIVNVMDNQSPLKQKYKGDGVHLFTNLVNVDQKKALKIVRPVSNSDRSNCDSLEMSNSGERKTSSTKMSEGVNPTELSVLFPPHEYTIKFLELVEKRVAELVYISPPLLSMMKRIAQKASVQKIEKLQHEKEDQKEEPVLHANPANGSLCSVKDCNTNRSNNEMEADVQEKHSECDAKENVRCLKNNSEQNSEVKSDVSITAGTDTIKGNENESRISTENKILTAENGTEKGISSVVHSSVIPQTNGKGWISLLPQKLIVIAEVKTMDLSEYFIFIFISLKTESNFVILMILFCFVLFRSNFR